MIRLTDNDRNFGPLTVARFKWAKAFYILISSGGDDEDEEGFRNHLKIQAFGWAVRLLLPNLIRPFVHRRKAGWDEAMVARLGRDWYEVSFAREYGFQFFEGDSFSILYGVQEHCGNLPQGVVEKRNHWFLPWAQWRHVRTSLFDQNGKHFWSEPDTNKMTRDERGAVRDDYSEFRRLCPRVPFWIEDYDGDIIRCETHIVEREWRRGEKWCSWLSWFSKPKVRRYLDLWFSAEVGPEKGSWKGGMRGHGIEMLPEELHESAFRRYCEMDHERKGRSFRLKFLGSSQPAPAP